MATAGPIKPIPELSPLWMALAEVLARASLRLSAEVEPDRLDTRTHVEEQAAKWSAIDGWHCLVEALLDRFVRETEPLRDGWSLVWLYGSQEAITAANKLFTTTTPAMSLATAEGKGRNVVIAAIAGETWTLEQDKEFGEALQKVGLARRDFALVARTELGAGTVDLFSGTDQMATSEDESTTKD